MSQVRWRAVGLCNSRKFSGYAFMPDCLQPSWPQVHMSSVLSPMPSQWALQYLSLLFSGMQLQAGLAHFFVPAIVTSEAGPARGRETPSMGS